ncbi:MAG: hypothetical protein U0992_00990 [Planctomycetaceae bacterium]
MYRFGQRIVIKVMDESVLNGIEDQTGRMPENAMRPVPNEIQAAREPQVEK